MNRMGMCYVVLMAFWNLLLDMRSEWTDRTVGSQLDDCDNI